MRSERGAFRNSRPGSAGATACARGSIRQPGPEPLTRAMVAHAGLERDDRPSVRSAGRPMDGSQLGTVHADLSSISTYPVPGLEPRRRKSMTRITKKAVDALSAREREYTSSAHSYGIAIRQHVLTRLGKRRVAEITRSDVAAMHHQMRDTPYAANRTLGILSAMFTAAELWELRRQGSNPCRHVKRFREWRRERFLSDAEYRRLGAVLREAESTGTVAASAIAAIRLLMLTGCRLSEIMTLRWDQVALEADARGGRTDVAHSWRVSGSRAPPSSGAHRAVGGQRRRVAGHRRARAGIGGYDAPDSDAFPVHAGRGSRRA